MADVNLLNSLNANQEADTSMILDTLMYTNGLNNRKYIGWTVGDIIDDMEADDLVGNDAKAALANLKQCRNSNNGAAVWDLKMQSCSDQYGDCEGACGAAFYSGNKTHPTDVYVAFRGTGDGRWYDNGDAFAKVSSPYQEAAVNYFDRVMKDMQVTDSCNVIPTGHSKGGNEAQFVALNSEYAHLIDKVISIDGQGFSPEAEKAFKKALDGKYGEGFYDAQCKKMYSICGDNDFVNVLGNKVIPEENTVYIKTNNDGFMNAHALYSETDGGNLFDYTSGKFFDTTDKQKEIALLAASLSSAIMTKPAFMRSDICHSIMSIMERILKDSDETVENLKVGLNGEKATFFEYIRAFGELLAIAGWEGLKKLKDGIGNLLEKFKASTPGQFLGQITASVIQAAKEKAIPGAMAVLDGVSDWISDKYKQGKEAVKNFGSNLLEAGKNFCNDVKNTFNKARDFITGNRGGTSSSGGHISDKGSGSSGFFGKQNSANIIIDEGALSKAISDFSDLSKQLQELRKDIEQMLTTLKAGFDTPAGRKFIKSCENNLITPLEQQRLVIEHISENLQSAQTCYSSVFSEYKDLVNKITSYQS